MVNEGMTRAAQAFLDRFIASDPGLTRLRTALRVLVTVVLAVVVLSLIGLPATAVMLGAIVAMVSSFAVTDPKVAQQAITFLALPVVAGVSLVIEALLEPYRAASDVGFLVIVFCAVYLRRFGSRGFAVGMVGFMTYFFALFVHATAAELWGMLAGALAGLACSALSNFLLVRGRPDRGLTATVAAFRARTARIVDAVIRLVEVGHPDRRREGRLRRRVDRLHECALMIEGILDDESAPDGSGPRTETAKRHLIETELAAERLARWAPRAIAEGIPEPDRSQVLAGLAELRVLLGRDPRPARNATARSAPLGAAGPGVQGLSWAVHEMTATVLTARHSITAVESADPAGRESPTPPDTVDADRPGPDPAPADGDGDEEEAAAGTVLADATESGRLLSTTRQAVQATVAAALAIVGGALLSGQHWYWAVITAFVVFGNTTSRGDILVKGSRRMVGTLLGIAAGIAGATAMAGHTSTTAVLIFVCVFSAYYLARVSYSLMTFFTTVALGLLYSLLGTLTPGVLVVRLEETVIGAVAGILAAVLVLPTSTRATIRSAVRELLRTLQRFVGHAMDLLVDGRPHDLVGEVRDIDRRLAGLRKAAAPMSHRMSPFRAQRDELRYLLALLDACAFYARALAAYAEAGALSRDDETARTGRRITANLDRLIAVVDGAPGARPPVLTGQALPVSIDPHDPGWPGSGPAPDDIGAPPIVRLVDRLDMCVLGLARPLHGDVALDPGAQAPSGARPPARP